MGKLGCPCGNTLSNVCVPNDVEGIAFNFYEKDFILGGGRTFWECKECGRLAFNHPGLRSSTVKWYVPENGESGDLI